MSRPSASPTDHDHTWRPAWDLGFAQYRCPCGATAFRRRIWGGVGRDIVPHQRPHH